MDNGQEPHYSPRLVNEEIELLQKFVDFARENGITKLDAGGFSFELAPVEIAKHAQERVERHLTDKEREALREKLIESRRRKGRPKNLEYWSSPDLKE